ncbi:hypothetical protein [uncultured Paraglaciecola sp.]|uniref:hypothetical protein n=1 Tax=uncultured Paraglaciecola sp. TaxID=1765024 RepID=UPI0026206D5C|nr:hypothetical protein [uncultured Paraglaciecola sp.]
MYTAMLLVMTLNGPMGLQDTQGPYSTEVECLNRALEMKAYVDQEMAGVRSIDFKCMKSDANELGA